MTALLVHPDIPAWWSAPGYAALTQRALPVRDFSPQLRSDVEHLARVMLRTPAAAGLAANQVGWNQAVFIADFHTGAEPLEPGTTPVVSRPLTACINPQIITVSKERVPVEEACLSVPGFYGRLLRPTTIRIRYQDVYGGYHRIILTGFFAQLAEHECDHLAGNIYLSRLLPPTVVRAADQQRFELDVNLQLPPSAFELPDSPTE